MNGRPAKPIERSWCQALRRGRLDHAHAILATHDIWPAAAVKKEVDPDKRAHAQWDSWIAAACSPGQVSLPWLNTHRPDLIPRGEAALFEALRLALKSEDVPLCTADWLVSETRLVTCTKQTRNTHWAWRQWVPAAIHRPDALSIHWLLRPDSPLGPFPITPETPWLLAIVQGLGHPHRTLGDAVMLAQAQEALAHGVQDVPQDGAATMNQTGHTALTWLAQQYADQEKEARRYNRPLSSDFRQQVLRLWTLLEAGGSDPNQVPRRGTSPLVTIAGTWLEHARVPAARQHRDHATAWEATSHARPRRRS